MLENCQHGGDNLIVPHGEMFHPLTHLWGAAGAGEQQHIAMSAAPVTNSPTCSSTASCHRDSEHFTKEGQRVSIISSISQRGKLKQREKGPTQRLNQQQSQE